MPVPLSKFLKFWLPVLVWMVLMFPVANTYLGSSGFFNLLHSAFKWMFPQASYSDFGTMYIIIRKSMHVLEYAVLCFLLWRAFRGMASRSWDLKWMLLAGFIALAYGFLDEGIQALLPSRHGTAVDVLFDASGILLSLVIITACRQRALSDRATG